MLIDPRTNSARDSEEMSPETVDEVAIESHVHKLRKNAAELRAAKKVRKKGDRAVQDDHDQQEVDALRGFERFHKLEPGTAQIDKVERSSAGISGWALFAQSHDAVAVDQLAEHEALQSKFLRDLGVVDELVER